MSIRVSLLGMLRPIRVDTLRKFHNVGFIAGRLICCGLQEVVPEKQSEYFDYSIQVSTSSK